MKAGSRYLSRGCHLASDFVQLMRKHFQLAGGLDAFLGIYVVNTNVFCFSFNSRTSFIGATYSACCYGDYVIFTRISSAVPGADFIAPADDSPCELVSVGSWNELAVCVTSVEISLTVARMPHSEPFPEKTSIRVIR